MIHLCRGEDVKQKELSTLSRYILGILLLELALHYQLNLCLMLYFITKLLRYKNLLIGSGKSWLLSKKYRLRLAPKALIKII